MDFECKDIPLSQIDATDRTFEISTDDSLEMLKASIQNLGLIHPPILIEKSRTAGNEVSYTPIAGFRRIEACRELKLRHLTANCLGADTPFYQCALVAITESHFQKTLNPVEKSRCFALIEQSGEQGDKVLRSLHAIGFHANDELISKFKKIHRMDRLIKNGVLEGSIAMPVALDLFDMSDQDGAMALAQLFVELRISLSRQRELMDWVQAIAHRERMEIAAVLDHEAVRRWRIDESLDPPRKANLIRDHFRKRRYPEISAFERKYNDTLKSLSLKKPLHLIPPPNFEGTQYSLKIDFKTVDELIKGLENSEKISQSPILKTLLDQTRS